MLLTMNQVLLIVLTLAAVVVATVLVIFLFQLRRTAAEAEKALGRAQELMEGFKETEARLNTNLDALGETVNHTKKALSVVSQLPLFFSSRASRPSSRYWPLLIPFLSYGWQLIKKIKEKKDGK